MSGIVSVPSKGGAGCRRQHGDLRSLHCLALAAVGRDGVNDHHDQGPAEMQPNPEKIEDALKGTLFTMPHAFCGETPSRLSPTNWL